MRTNVEIDNALMSQAMAAAGLPTKRATIELAILQGARDELDAARIERGLRRFAVVPLLDPDLASRAARNYRALRELGITVRKAADIVIGTFCIEKGHALLHDDRDFLPMALEPYRCSIDS